MYFADVPKNVQRSAAAYSNNTAGEGWNGEPSKSISVAPDASAETSQFHIIQPSVVK
jgi:hypothetical protein